MVFGDVSVELSREDSKVSDNVCEISVALDWLHRLIDMDALEGRQDRSI